MHKNDVIYGCSIDEYCDKHKITVDELINSVRIDISMLKDRVSELGDVMHKDFDIVYKALSKKQTHLSRLEEWKNN